jgi:hypothetical protein
MDSNGVFYTLEQFPSIPNCFVFRDNVNNHTWSIDATMRYYNNALNSTTPVVFGYIRDTTTSVVWDGGVIASSSQGAFRQAVPAC